MFNSLSSAILFSILEELYIVSTIKIENSNLYFNQKP